MLQEAAMRSVGLFHRWASPKNIGSISKYLYIRNLIEQYHIDKILDVGANTGQFAHAMRRIGFKGDIYSFEPVLEQFENLKTASAVDNRWHVFNFALGSHAGYQNINVTKSSVFSSFNLPTTSETSMFATGNSVDRSERVEIRRLDHFAQEQDIASHLDHCFLKCDTQGYDLHVLEGAGDLIKSISLFQVELSVTRLYEGAPNMIEMLEFLQRKSISPVALFTINKKADWGAIEFDYLGINQNQLMAEAI